MNKTDITMGILIMWQAYCLYDLEDWLSVSLMKATVRSGLDIIDESWAANKRMTVFKVMFENRRWHGV